MWWGKEVIKSLNLDTDIVILMEFRKLGETLANLLLLNSQLIQVSLAKESFLSQVLKSWDAWDELQIWERNHQASDLGCILFTYKQFDSLIDEVPDNVTTSLVIITRTLVAIWLKQSSDTV